MKTDNKTKVLNKRSATIHYGQNQKSVDVANNIGNRAIFKALQSSEKIYRRLFETAQDGILLLDADTGQITDINPFLLELLSYSYKELIGKKLWEIGLFQDILASRETFRALQEKSYIRYEDLPLETKDGKKIEVEFISNVYLVDNHKVIQCNIRDISERKIIEKLRESNDKYRDLFKQSRDAIYISTQDGRFIDINEAMLSLLGYTKEEMLKMSIQDIYVDYTEDSKLKNEIGKIDFGHNFEVKCRKKDGTVIDCLLTSTPQLSTDKVVLRNQGIIHDITERKRIEEQIRKSKDLLQTVIDSIPDWIVVKDSQHRYLLINKKFAMDQNLKSQEIVGKSDVDILPAEIIMGNPQKGIRGIHDEEADVLNGNLIHVPDVAVNFPDGSLHIFDTYRMPLRDSMGNNYGIISYSRDITEQSKSADDLRQSYQKTRKALNQTVETIAIICETRDPYTAGHQVRVTKLACAVAREMGMPKEKIAEIKIGGTLHDVGKMFIPAEILAKPGKLSEIEFSMIKNHPQVGYDIVRGIEFPCSITQMILQHHERLDGSGYPNGISNEDIIIEAKILSVADVVEAMSSHRPYRPALGIDKALNEITQNKGKLYDPIVVDTCLKLFNEKDFNFE